MFRPKKVLDDADLSPSVSVKVPAGSWSDDEEEAEEIAAETFSTLLDGAKPTSILLF